VEALKDPNLWVGSYAAHTLGRLGDAEVIPALKDYARRAERESQVDAAERAIEMIRSRAKQE
jgi:HEAT repeat protein